MLLIKRYDASGRDVTDLPGMWSDDDVEIAQTNANHPYVTSGQHTNGPAGIWVRPAKYWMWHNTGRIHMHKVLEDLVAGGIGALGYPTSDTAS